MDRTFSIHSGKLRRYHGEGLRQIFDLPTTVKNIRDVFLVMAGIVESFFLLRREKPDIIFLKGGFVGVPIGLVAAAMHIPYITHDSDALPGLANRLIARWAVAHAVAMPKDAYSYPKAKTYQTGVPISADYSLVTAAKQAGFKKSFNLDSSNPVLCITGGGLGALRLNESIVHIAKALLSRHPQLHILHLAGRGKATALNEAYRKALGAKAVQVDVKEFVEDFYRYSGAADVIVARAGANSLAEFAAQAKACIIVPNQQLTGGHQLKNAQVLEDSRAIVCVPDESVQKNPEILLQQIEMLLSEPKRRLELARNLHATADAKAAEKIADLILDSMQKVRN